MTREQIAHLATARGSVTASAEDTRQLALHTLRLMDRVEHELTAHSDAIRAGMELAKRKGRQIGRPRVEIDMERVAALWAEGYSVKAIARETGHKRATVRRRMIEAGYFGEVDIATPERCEGCAEPATTRDSMGVPLCDACYDALEFDDEAAL